jgi:hypothetical protein
MKINQLFRAHVPLNIYKKIYDCFDLSEDKKSFTKQDLEKSDTLNRIEAIKDELYLYYLPCKSLIYLDNLDINKCITILRQIARLHQILLCSKQKYHHNRKITIYFLKNVRIEDENLIVPITSTHILNDQKKIITFL